MIGFHSRTVISIGAMLAVLLGACSSDDVKRTLYNTARKTCEHKLSNCDVHDRGDAGK